MAKYCFAALVAAHRTNVDQIRFAAIFRVRDILLLAGKPSSSKSTSPKHQFHKFRSFAQQALRPHRRPVTFRYCQVPFATNSIDQYQSRPSYNLPE